LFVETKKLAVGDARVDRSLYVAKKVTVGVEAEAMALNFISKVVSPCQIRVPEQRAAIKDFQQLCIERVVKLGMLDDRHLWHEHQGSIADPRKPIVMLVASEGRAIYSPAHFRQRTRRLDVPRLGHAVHFPQKQGRVVKVLDRVPAVQEVNALVGVGKPVELDVEGMDLAASELRPRLAINELGGVLPRGISGSDIDHELSRPEAVSELSDESFGNRRLGRPVEFRQCHAPSLTAPE